VLPVSFGWAGVDVFFVLSGFLITGILFDSRDAPHRVRNFYIRRTLRIFPLYYGLFLVLVVLYPIFRWHWSWTWLLWPGYLGNFLVFLPPALVGKGFTAASGELLSLAHRSVVLHIGHFWSLCVEEQYYLVWPWIVFWLKDRRKLITICVLVILVCPLLRIFAGSLIPAYAINGDALYYSTPFRVDALMFGALVALLRRGPAHRRMIPAARWLLAAFAVAAVILLAVAKFGPHAPPTDAYPLWRLSLKLSVADILSACVVILALEPRTWTYNILSLPGLRWIGRITYGAYVLHEIPRTLLTQMFAPYFTRPAIPAAALAFVLTMAVAWLSFRYFESPFIRLKNRWTR
jgi:peptidoglycan/LPS O-acetylase OafA/YrhL